MVVAILQPGYLPWLGFFEQMYKSDIFVIYDDVQYDKLGWRNRNRIKTANGIQWLTVPVKFSLEKKPLVKEVEIDTTQNWKKKHLMSIRQNYSKARYFKDNIGIFEEAFSMDWGSLMDLDMHFIEKLASALGMGDKRVLRSSSLDIKGDRIERLINICKDLNADTFYEGAAGRNYIDVNDFKQEGITVAFQDYKHPTYNQLYGQFVPYLSIIDLLFNCGSESLSVILGEKEQ
jgi:hypothetical protein